MKKTFTTALLLLGMLGITNANAQEETYVSEDISIGRATNGNGFSLNVNGLVLEITEKIWDNNQSSYDFNYSYNKKKKHYLNKVSSTEFGFNYFDTEYSIPYPDYPGFMDMRMGRSFHFAGNLFEAATNIDRRGILGLSTAVRFVWNQLYFNNRYTITGQDGILIPMPLEDRYEKSKIKTFGLQMPLYLDLNINKASISVGGYGGLNLITKTKIKSPKEKESLSYVNPFEYGLSARIAWDDISLFVNYPLSNFFEDERGLNSQLFTIGFGF